MGGWYYTPPGQETATATLHDPYQCVSLRYSAGPVHDLLTRLARIETAYVAAAGRPHDHGVLAGGDSGRYGRA